MQTESMQRADKAMRNQIQQPAKVDMDKPLAMKPGALRGESTLIVKTRLAQRLVFGRSERREDKKVAIIGLIGFSGMLKQLCMGVKLDDPYADLWLINVEAAIEEGQAEIASMRATISEALAERPDFSHGIAQSTRPLEVPLYFSNQMAFKAAYLINDYDNLVCAAMTAKHVAVMTSVAADDLIRKGGKAVRRAFCSANGYSYTGVARADIHHGTAKAKRPREAWGEIAHDILTGERRASCAPDLPPKSYANSVAQAHAENA
ncbi:MAG: TIGR03761 family integrating conjugative element protein [Pseudomonadota bacterium]